MSSDRETVRLTVDYQLLTISPRVHTVKYSEGGLGRQVVLVVFQSTKYLSTEYSVRSMGYILIHVRLQPEPATSHRSSHDTASRISDLMLPTSILSTPYSVMAPLNCRWLWPVCLFADVLPSIPIISVVGVIADLRNFLQARPAMSTRYSHSVQPTSRVARAGMVSKYRRTIDEGRTRCTLTGTIAYFHYIVFF